MTTIPAPAVDLTTVGPTALHAWLVIADAISQHGMPAPEAVSVYNGHRGVVIDLATGADAAAWAKHLGLLETPSPFPSDWAGCWSERSSGWRWTVQCMTDRTAVTS